MEEELGLPFVRDRIEQELRANLAEFRKAEEAFKALDSAPQGSVEPEGVKDAPSSPATAAPAFAQTAAPSGGGKTTYRFAGIVAGSLKTYLFRGGASEKIVPYKCIVSDQPFDFEVLLPECPPDSIGAVRAAARAARMVRELRDEGKDPLRSKKFKKFLVFQGIDNEGPKPKAVFAVYNGRTGGSEPPFRMSLPELREAMTDRANSGEHNAAIAALEALGNENAPSEPAPVAATQSGAREPFSRGAGAVDAPKVGVRCTGVVTELRKGPPHAEAGFRDTSAFGGTARTGGSGKTWLTAGQIGGKIASLAEGHPDRAVYEAALKQVELKDKELGSVPVRVMDEFRPR